MLGLTSNTGLIARALALSLLFCLSFFGCGGSSTPSPTNARIEPNFSNGSYTLKWDYETTLFWFQILETDLDDPSHPAELPIMQPLVREKTFTGKADNKRFSYSLRMVQYDSTAGKLNALTAWTPAVTIDTSSLYRAPQPPTNVKATVGTNGQMTVTWDAPLGGFVSHYKVDQRRKDSVWSEWANLASAHTVPPYTHTIATTGLYQYQIAACNAKGCGTSASSPEITVTINETITTAPLPAVATDPDPSAQGDDIGSIAGSFRVNESGAATYDVPIFAIPGTAGVTLENFLR